MKTTLRPLAVAIALINASSLMAADEPEVRELESVIISASRSETKVEEMPLHTTVISREEIARSPAQTLDQLLRDVPGMNFTGVPANQSDPTGHQTKMRGLGNAKVLVLLDGVPIHDPFYMTTQWFKVPLSNIERVEVVRGGNSSLWGNMAVGGVVNIVSKRV
jgi:outer membrane receptor for ferrienterochelin and colicin